MEVLKGKSVSEGIAIGRIWIFDREEISCDEPVILVADDLIPGDLTSVNQSKAIALVIRRDSANSHITNLAQTLNIPVLIGVEFADDMNQKMAIVDGYEGLFYVEPVDEVVDVFSRKTDRL